MNPWSERNWQPVNTCWDSALKTNKDFVLAVNPENSGNCLMEDVAANIVVSPFMTLVADG